MRALSRCYPPTLRHAASTVGGNESSRLRKVTTCHIVESGIWLPHAAIPEYRTPCFTIQYNCQSGLRGGVRANCGTRG